MDKPLLKRKKRTTPHFFARVIDALCHGDAWVRLSALVCGASCFARGQYVKGVLLTLAEALLVWLIPGFFWPSMRKLNTLGTVQAEKVFNPETLRNEWNAYDNSFMILLFGVMGVLLTLTAVILWLRNLVHARELEQRARAGHHINSFREDVADCFHAKFHRTLLFLPVMGVVLLVIVPLIIMVCIAFTNYDRFHLVPANLFTWVGLSNFRALFDLSANGAFGYAFVRVLVWTLIWAVFATFTSYFGGILLAMLIGGKKTRCKKLWRSLFMLAIAVPQFVSLLLVRNFFHDQGIVNTICANIGLTGWLKEIGAIHTNYIPFLTDERWAKPMIILINMWVGIPYQMLIAGGVLMNIPTELLESARIDGAGPWQSFRNITMPYILFVTGPSLVNGLVSNINNFNVIYLLTQDVYTSTDQMMASASAKEVDLLVTWLYRLTQEQSNYKMASVVGILVFVVCSVLTLFAFGRLIRGDKEATFQ